MAKRRLKQGVDWHGWCWEWQPEEGGPWKLVWWAEPERKSRSKPSPEAKRVRVKFMKVP